MLQTNFCEMNKNRDNLAKFEFGAVGTGRSRRCRVLDRGCRQYDDL